MQVSPMLGNCSATKSCPRGDRFNPELLLKGWKAMVLDPGNGLRKGFALGSELPLSLPPPDRCSSQPDLLSASTCLLFHCHFLFCIDSILKVPLLHFLSDAG